MLTLSLKTQPFLHDPTLYIAAGILFFALFFGVKEQEYRLLLSIIIGFPFVFIIFATQELVVTDTTMTLIEKSLFFTKQQNITISRKLHISLVKIGDYRLSGIRRKDFIRFTGNDDGEWIQVSLEAFKVEKLATFEREIQKAIPHATIAKDVYF